VCAKDGIDLSTSVSADTIKCLKKEGYEFAIPRVYMETDEPDPAGAETVKLAHQHGFARVDGYIFPCFHCKRSAKEQVDATVTYLKSKDANVSALWIDIEGTQWSKTHSENSKFVEEMARAIRKHGIPFGYYMNENSYDGILAPWKNPFNDALLWYAAWDKVKSFGDFRPFGGFSKPHMKQYTGGITICGRSDLVDQNWKPK